MRPRPPAVDEIKILIMMTRWQNILREKECFAAFVIIIKNFNFINSRRPWLPNHIFFILAFLVLGHYSFNTRGGLVEISLLFLGVFPLNDHDLIVLIIPLVYAGIFKPCRLAWPVFLTLFLSK